MSTDCSRVVKRAQIPDHLLQGSVTVINFMPIDHTDFKDVRDIKRLQTNLASQAKAKKATWSNLISARIKGKYKLIYSYVPSLIV